MSQPPETASVVSVTDLAMLLLSEFGQRHVALGIVALGAANGAVSDWSMKAVHTLMNSISRSQPAPVGRLRAAGRDVAASASSGPLVCGSGLRVFTR